MASPEEFKSADEIESAFETDKPFSEETPQQSLGRFAWLCERSSAEFLLTLRNIGVGAEYIPDVMDAMHELLCDHYDFVLTGLDPADKEARDAHPLEASIRDEVDEITNALQERSERSPMDMLLNDRSLVDGMLKYGEMADEDLLHALNAMKHELSPDSTDI